MTAPAELPPRQAAALAELAEAHARRVAALAAAEQALADEDDAVYRARMTYGLTWRAIAAVLGVVVCRSLKLPPMRRPPGAPCSPDHHHRAPARDRPVWEENRWTAPNSTR